jgi:cell division septation protein DedD
MEKYILSLLKENSRVIIPEFGAFIIRQLNPPEIAFNSLLTFNDGILTEYVSQHAGISFIEASAKVSDYAEKLKADLLLHNRLTFNEIGWVWTDDTGEKQFTPWKETGRIQTETHPGMKDIESILKEAELTAKSEAEIIPESPIIPTGEQVPFILDDTLKDVDIDATKDILPKKSPEEEAVTPDTSPESFLLEDSGITETLADISVEKPITPQEEASTEQFIQKNEISDKQVIVTEETTNSPVSESIPFKPKKSLEQVWQENELKSADFSKTQKEKKKRSWIIPVSIIGVLIILAVAAWLVFPDQVKNIFNPNRQAAYEEAIPEEGAIEGFDITSAGDDKDEQVPDMGATTDLDEEEATVQTETPFVPDNYQASGNKYYVVAGCFKSRLNAEKYVAELRDKGFNAELFGTHDNLFAVSFSSFSSRNQALNEMKRIRETIEPKAWVLLY